MSKKAKYLLPLLLLLITLTGCAAPKEDSRITVVTAIFPEYDWVRQIIGPDSDIALHLLVDDGVDPHSFQPTVSDLVTASGCDLLIWGGGESDKWLEDVLKEPSNPDILSLELLPLLGEQAHMAETVQGMQIREEEEETDEHFWLSLRNAAFLCQEIAQALCQIDPINEAKYQANLDSYLKKLSALDEQWTQTISGGRTDTIVVCDRFPFRYLVEDYGLNYYAAFPGCSAESGASFATIIFLADRVNELELGAVLITEGSDTRIADTVAVNSGRSGIQVLTLDSMQAVSQKDAVQKTYLHTMEQNMLVMEQALR